MSQQSDWSRFPTDEMSLRGLIEACSPNEETGRSHLHDYLDMTARVKSVTNQATDETYPDIDAALAEADHDDGPPVFFVEHEPGTEPHSEQTVIISLAEEILRAQERIADYEVESTHFFDTKRQAMGADLQATQERERGLVQEVERLRESASNLLHLLTYDQDPRTYNAQMLGAINELGNALAAQEEESDATR